MTCASIPNAPDKDAGILYIALGLLASQIGMRYLGIYATVFLPVGNRATFCITPHIVTLSLTRESGGIVIHDRVTLRNDSA